MEIRPGDTDSGDEGRDDGGDGKPSVIDPVAITESARDDDSGGDASLGYLPNGQPRKRRRRTREQIEADRAAGREPPRSIPSSGGSQKGGSLSVNSIQFALTGIHALLAAGFSTPELELTETEATTISQNIVAVARHYDLQQTAKATDIGNLVISLSIVYAGRFVRISTRKKAERLQRRAAHGEQPGVTIPQPVTPAPQSGSKAAPTNGSRLKNDADLMLLNEHEAYVA